jgi:hypothetical protein
MTRNSTGPFRSLSSARVDLAERRGPARRRPLLSCPRIRQGGGVSANDMARLWQFQCRKLRTPSPQVCQFLFARFISPVPLVIAPATVTGGRAFAAGRTERQVAVLDSNEPFSQGSIRFALMIGTVYASRGRMATRMTWKLRIMIRKREKESHRDRDTSSWRDHQGRLPDPTRHERHRACPRPRNPNLPPQRDRSRPPRHYRRYSTTPGSLFPHFAGSVARTPVLEYDLRTAQAKIRTRISKQVKPMSTAAA